MRAAWTRNFWTKTVAFLLAAALVPVMLAYGVGLACSYGGMGKDFYTSDICQGAVSHEAWDIRDTYIYAASNEYLPEDYFPADDAHTNIRFTVTDRDGNEEFSNTGEGDIACYSAMMNGKYFSFYLVEDLPAQDDIYWAKVFFDKANAWGKNAAAMLAVLGIAELFLFIFLARAAGRCEDGSLQPGWQEKIPFDLYLFIDTSVIALLCAAAAQCVYEYANYYTPPYDVLLMAICFGIAVFVLGAWVTFCTRIKTGGLWKGTLIYKILCLCWRIVKWCWGVLCAFCRGCVSFLHAIPLVWRTAVGCFVVGVMICLMADRFYYDGGKLILFLFVLSIAVCLFSVQLRKLQKEAEALASGDMSAQVDTKWMYWDVKRHAENLNSIGDGMAMAVDKQLKSERLKTELITNVSHDIKTPLTSIINYVDLLQHEHTPEQEEEYLAVLKRQAFKLKKLTEDLVEASKATTGNLPVNAVRCSMNELLAQVEGEYGDKLSAAELTLVNVMPEKELFCNVDGALMWRVIDNLLSNICKYAQSGTRVYLTLEKTGGDAVVTFKNTSRAALNIPAEELMERFVRGDSSRSTEGNGLGLSIAQSLTELQGGKMSLAIDGDLFKAILRFPTVA